MKNDKSKIIQNAKCEMNRYVSLVVAETLESFCHYSFLSLRWRPVKTFCDPAFPQPTCFRVARHECYTKKAHRHLCHCLQRS